jgi:hypothetical protein
MNKLFRVYYTDGDGENGSFQSCGDDIHQALEREKNCGGVCDGWRVVGIVEIDYIGEIFPDA